MEPTVRDYFAAMAPRKPPAWFVHVPAPGRPTEPPDPAPYNRDAKCQIDETARYNAEYAALEPLRKQYQDAMVAWCAADEMLRLVKWRWHWADAMIAARGGDIRDFEPAAEFQARDRVHGDVPRIHGGFSAATVVGGGAPAATGAYVPDWHVFDIDMSARALLVRDNADHGRQGRVNDPDQAEWNAAVAMAAGGAPYRWYGGANRVTEQGAP